MLIILGVTLCGIVVGVLTGVTGMGGILIPPVMIMLLGMDTHVAMGTSMASFLPSCAIAAWKHHRYGNLSWPLAVPLSAAGAVCAFLGTMLKAYSPGHLLNLLLAILVIAVGAMAFRPVSGKDASTPHDRGWMSRSSARLGLLGGFVGILSGLTGAGGSVLTVPAMIVMGYGPLTAIATGMVFVVGVSVIGTVGNALHNAVDFPLAALCASGQILGLWMGLRVARFLDAAVLKNIVAVVCIMTGAWILAKTLWAWM